MAENDNKDYNDINNSNDRSRSEKTSNTNPKTYECGITPEVISELRPNEILVFPYCAIVPLKDGNSYDLLRGLGEAKSNKEGLHGHTYIIPLKFGSISELRRSVDDFNMFAFYKGNPHLHFIVTKNGWESAGFTMEQIAPLFRKSMDLPNVSLPKEYIDYILSHPLVPNYVIKKVHGQIRTLVDMICEINKEYHFKSGEEVEQAIWKFFYGCNSKYKRTLNTIAHDFSIHAVSELVYPCITAEGLDIEHLYLRMKELETDPEIVLGALERAYRDYILEKTIKLVELLNEFRRYNKAKFLLRDLREIEIGYPEMGIMGHEYYLTFGSFQVSCVRHDTIKYWDKIAPNGTLDNELYMNFMYRRLRNDIAELGLEAVLGKDYQEYNYCHSDSIGPKPGIVGPKYINKFLLDSDMNPTQKRRLLVSCGWVKSKDSNIDYFEFQRIVPLIEKDPKYILVVEKDEYYSYLVPKDDVTLPLYHRHRGKMLFESEEAKHQAIRKIWCEHPELFPRKE